ncbi:MAG: hypothetical protein NVSMB46_01430 [Candidatus Saccharimonadales bacterium]
MTESKKEVKNKTKKIKAPEVVKKTEQEDKDSVKANKTTASVPKAKEVTTKDTAKSGKRSDKAIKETEAKIAKEEKKSNETSGDDSKPKQKQNRSRTQLERKGKKYRKLAEAIDKSKSYGLKDAISLVLKTSPVKFDATVEIHVRLGVDPRHADQNIRDTIVLPSGTGKKVRIAVFAENDDVTAALKAGADTASNEEFLKQLDKGIIDFDVLIAPPMMMPKLGKYARLLGPKGLMPNPKSGTVAADVSKAVTEARAGRLEYRVDSTGIVHAGVGKVSFGEEKLLVNLQAIISSIKSNKPVALKGTYVKAIHLTSSMGPSVLVDLGEIN